MAIEKLKINCRAQK